MPKLCCHSEENNNNIYTGKIRSVPREYQSSSHITELRGEERKITSLDKQTEAFRPAIDRILSEMDRRLNNNLMSMVALDPSD